MVLIRVHIIVMLHGVLHFDLKSKSTCWNWLFLEMILNLFSFKHFIMLFLAAMVLRKQGKIQLFFPTKHWLYLKYETYCFSFHLYQCYISDSITKTIIRSAHGCVHDIRVHNRLGCKEDKLDPPENVVGILDQHKITQNQTAGWYKKFANLNGLNITY